MNKTKERVMFALVVLLAALFIYQCFNMLTGYDEVLAQTWTQEIWTAQGLAGALLENHPELEQEIAAALQPPSLAQYQAIGAELMSSYGFGNQQSVENTRYQSLRVRWQNLLVLLVVTAALLLFLLICGFRFLDRRKRERVQDILEQYLSENYAFAASTAPLLGGLAGNKHSYLSDLIKQLGNTIRLKNLRLTEEQENTKSLVTDISHQIKTPIASLQTCLTMALEADDTEERNEFLERSRQQVEKLENLTSALMNISRMETSMIELRPAWVSLQALLVKAANAVYDKARAKSILMEMGPFQDVHLMLDERWTAEALMNILDNSIKYSPAGSNIKITVEPLVSFIRITIADEGIGIPRDELSHIFQRFYRGSHPSVKSAEGAGVGLYLTRMILERQGGGVSAKSQPGKGSVFAVQLFKATAEEMPIPVRQM